MRSLARVGLLGLMAALLVAAPASAGFGGPQDPVADEPPSPPEAPPPEPDTRYLPDAESPEGLQRVDVSHLPFDEDRLDDQQPIHPYDNWYTITAQLFQYVQDNPGIARLHSAGTSHWGFDLWVIEVADFHDTDKIPLDERESIYLDGGTHANEDLGIELTMLWVEHLVEGYGEDENATWIVENRHTAMMPLVNPDGHHYNSRLNGATVNVNRNFPVGWKAVDENAVFNDPGPYPASEPETQAVLDTIDALEPDYLNSFHTGIELMLYPWGYTEEYPEDMQTFDRICKEIGEPDRDFCGPVFETIYPASGVTTDTAYERYGTVAFTYELSDEQGAPASVDDPRQRLQRYWDGVAHAFHNVERYGANLEIVGLEVVGEAPDVTVEAQLENTGYGNASRVDVGAALDGAEADTAAVGEVPAGETATAKLNLDASEADVQDDVETHLTLELTYPERQKSPEPTTETVEVALADAGDGSITVVEDTLDDVPVETDVDLASSGDAGDGALDVPAPGLAAALAAAALAAAGLGRRGG